jgi:hypothetical protein
MGPSNHWQILSRLSGIGALRRLPHWRERSNQGPIEKRPDALGVEKKNKRTVQLRCLDLFRIGSPDNVERSGLRPEPLYLTLRKMELRRV